MGKKANKTMIGLFVAGSIVLLIMAILAFGSGTLFRRTVDYVLFFNGSVKGLSVGGPVIFRGVRVGYVKDISLIYNETTGAMLTPVIIKVEPSRAKAFPVKGAAECRACSDYELLVKQGLRAKLVMQTVLTGELMVALDFYPDKPAKLYGLMKQYPELPTLPIEEISQNLENAVAGINKFINSEDVQESFSELKETLQETRRAARSFRLLTEYLEEHPDAILKGKSVSEGEQV